MTFEVWFLYAVAAAVFAGINVYSAKVASARGYDSKLFNSLVAFLAAGMGLVVAASLEDLSEFSIPMLLLAILIGGVYITGSILRMDGLRHIDAMIMLPLHKV